MSFLKRLFGKGGKTGKESDPTSRSARPSPPTRAEISRVYMYVGSTVPVNEATCEQIRGFALQQLKADPTFREIMAKVESGGVSIVKGHGVAPSPQHFVGAFSKWLETQGISLDQAHPVMGKKFFVQGGDAQNPADGSKFSWGLVGCFY